MNLLRQSKLLLDLRLSASSLALALLCASACEPKNSTIGSFDDPVSGGECSRPGETRGLRDGCNECTCGDGMHWVCTTLACDGGTSGTSGAGGSGGDGGGGGDGGSAVGSGGSAGSSGSAGSAGTGGCSQQCSAPEVSWSWEGGFVPYRRNSTLSGCRKYTHVRTPVDVLLPQRECSVTLECTEQAIQQALSRADVVAAFDSGTMYGKDARATDGSLLIVTHQGKDLTVGFECPDGGPPNCIPIPTGVRALADAIRALDQQMWMRAECASIFGG